MIGIGFPLGGIPLRQQRDVLAVAADLGYTSVWTSEANGTDAVTPLALAAAWQPGMDIASSVVPVQTRGPALLAQTFAALAEATAASVTLGIGASTPAIVHRWNALPYERPVGRARDLIRFLRAAFSGARVDQRYETFAVAGFRLARPVERPPRILLAAGRPRMLTLAGAEADGALINCVSPQDVAVIAPIVQRTAAAPGSSPAVVGRLYVCPSTDRDHTRDAARSLLCQYFAAPGYRQYHEWMGRGERLRHVLESWDAGRYRQAAASIPDDLLDDVVVSGSPAECRQRLQEYADAGLTGMNLVFIGAPGGHGAGQFSALRRLGPVADVRRP